MIKLYAACPAWDVPNISPFVLKVECYLRMVGLPYEFVSLHSPEDFAHYGYGPAEFEAVAAQVRDVMRTELHGHGLGRHSRQEVYALGKADLTALSSYLEEKPYFLGKEPTALDATAYGFLANIFYVD